MLDGLQFERLCSASGPTGGHVLRPSDHKEPKNVVFIQCSGSRDPEQHCAYCSKICCMYTAKHATLYKHHVPDGKAYVFYIDIRSGGKGYEEFVQRAMERDGVMYLRGRVSKVYQSKGKLKVLGVDTLSGKNVEIDADMVVLAQAMVPSKGTADVAKTLKIGRDKDGFLAEAHPEAAAGRERHRRHLPDRRGAGAEGHPRDRLPGECGGGQGHSAAVEAGAGAQPGGGQGARDRIAPAARCASMPAPTRPLTLVERQGVGQRGAVRRLRYLFGNLRARGHRREERHAVADLRHDQRLHGVSRSVAREGNANDA